MTCLSTRASASGRFHATTAFSTVNQVFYSQMPHARAEKYFSPLHHDMIFTYFSSLQNDGEWDKVKRASHRHHITRQIVTYCLLLDQPARDRHIAPAIQQPFYLRPASAFSH